MHGHVHDSFDYEVGRCRVRANPAGYIRNRGWAKGPDEFVFENTMDNSTWVSQLKALLLKYDTRVAMHAATGFSTAWASDPIWSI